MYLIVKCGPHLQISKPMHWNHTDAKQIILQTKNTLGVLNYSQNEMAVCAQDICDVILYQVVAGTLVEFASGDKGRENFATPTDPGSKGVRGSWVGVFDFHSQGGNEGVRGCRSHSQQSCPLKAGLCVCVGAK